MSILDRSFFKNYRFRQNFKELIFADKWFDEVEQSNGKILDYILTSDPENPEYSTDRDHLVAARVIQWLGSPVGQSFIEKVQSEFKNNNDHEEELHW